MSEFLPVNEWEQPVQTHLTWAGWKVRSVSSELRIYPWAKTGFFFLPLMCSVAPEIYVDAKKRAMQGYLDLLFLVKEQHYIDFFLHGTSLLTSCELYYFSFSHGGLFLLPVRLDSQVQNSFFIAHSPVPALVLCTWKVFYRYWLSEVLLRNHTDFPMLSHTNLLRVPFFPSFDHFSFLFLPVTNFCGPGGSFMQVGLRATVYQLLSSLLPLL